MGIILDAYITSLGKYAERQLVDETLNFPAAMEEVQSLLRRIGWVGVRDKKILPLVLPGFFPYCRYCPQYEFLLGEILWQLENFPDRFSEAFFLALE